MSKVDVSVWTPVVNRDGTVHCCMRYIIGTDPDVIANRVAFIEKSPRVRIGNDPDNEMNNWEYGPKGSGGENPQENKLYGFYPPSREWCDARLIELGYNLTN